MKTIYVVRHGQAEGQEPGAKLTENGVQQAARLVSFFGGRQVDCILSSPFERAYSTILPLARQRGIQIQTDERLAERVLSGGSHPEWREMLRRTYDDLDLCWEGGESGRAAMKRAAAVVEEVLNSHYTSAVLVSHGNLISLLLKLYDERIGFAEWERLTNPDVYQFSFRDELPEIQRIWNP
ncbi:histidine phosphatase family protein [Paenibacillus caseinilyticus]|uniref:Phosphoglycerate mutase n=1 Tax=Paenibacillus mucilaginosus K02 TaxID=997761 RepID=I0BJG1_9BACL|nr:histidine phosphatase family protein [Paenibacillus mucilaginosus]AFH62508.1 phosphoglycerate mutase [Paenibacillus mucilaginosus K02]